MEKENHCVKKYFAEMLGTMFLVLFGCGVAVWTGANVVATALAFGLTIVAMSFCVGNASGAHLNPAVSFSLLLAKRLSFKDFIGYVCSQLIGAAIACLLLLLFFGRNQSYGANVIQSAISGHYGAGGAVVVALVAETVLTFAFTLSVLGVTSKTENKGVIGFVIGLALTLVHLLGIGLTGTSVNPARSLIPAFFAGGEALREVWIYIVGPLLGAAFAALCYAFLDDTKKHELSENRAY
ncbi:MAG: aquaporin [Clostridia bacterium]|nr:aquaporin [Clostridia bacterium]